MQSAELHTTRAFSIWSICRKVQVASRQSQRVDIKFPKLSDGCKELLSSYGAQQSVLAHQRCPRAWRVPEVKYTNTLTELDDQISQSSRLCQEREIMLITKSAEETDVTREIPEYHVAIVTVRAVLERSKQGTRVSVKQSTNCLRSSRTGVDTVPTTSLRSARLMSISARLQYSSAPGSWISAYDLSERPDLRKIDLPFYFKVATTRLTTIFHTTKLSPARPSLW